MMPLTQPVADRRMWRCTATELTSKSLTSPCKPHTPPSGVSSGQRDDLGEDIAFASCCRHVLQGLLG